MVDAFTPLLRLVLQETGGNENVWGFINNSSLIDLLDDAIAGREDVDVTLSDQTLMGMNGDDDPARAAILIVQGNPGTTREVIVPSTSKIYVVTNETSPGFDITIKTALGSGTVITPGTRSLVFVDSTADDVVPVSAPQATEDVQGIAEIATQAEVDAGTDDERIVTPLKLAAFPAVNTATEDIEGVAEIATQLETDNGVLDDKIVSPLKLEGRQSTTVLTGLARRATQTEVNDGTETDAFVTPETLENKPGALGSGRQGALAQRAMSRMQLNNGVDTAIIMDTEIYDTSTIGNGFFDLANPTRMTIPTGSGITYVRFSMGIAFESSNAGARQIQLRKNGGSGGVDPSMGGFIPAERDGSAIGDPYEMMMITPIIEVAETDYFEFFAENESGSSLIGGIAETMWFLMEVIE